MCLPEQRSNSHKPSQTVPCQNRRTNLRFSIPLVRRAVSVPFFHTVRRAFAIFRTNPFFTPRLTFSRWRSHRALRAAARAARDRRPDRDWQENFRMNGLTWHHLYITQDLRRIVLFLRELQRRTETPNTPKIGEQTLALVSQSVLGSPAVGAVLVRLERSYAFLLDNVSDVYNSLEKHVLFPWIEAGIPDNAALSRALLLFSKERERIEDEADRIQSRFARLVCTTGYPYSSLGPCSKARSYSATRSRREKRRRERTDARSRASAWKDGGEEGAVEEVSRRRRSSMFIREGYKQAVDENRSEPPAPIEWRSVSMEEVRQITMGVHTLLDDTERLHKTERSLLYPLISKSFTAKEQLRLTYVLVYSMRAALAKFLIAVYHQSVQKHATLPQWKWYKREVPLPIRVYTPVWRARLYDGSPLGWLRATPVRDIGRANISAF